MPRNPRIPGLLNLSGCFQSCSVGQNNMIYRRKVNCGFGPKLAHTFITVRTAAHTGQQDFRSILKNDSSLIVRRIKRLRAFEGKIKEELGYFE